VRLAGPLTLAKLLCVPHRWITSTTMQELSRRPLDGSKVGFSASNLQVTGRLWVETHSSPLHKAVAKLRALRHLAAAVTARR
jgi:hypothetical protein